MTKQNLSEIAKSLPTDPGCYIYRDQSGQVIYVGKAKNLRKRVSSYFSKEHSDQHIANLVNEIFDIEHIITDSELEAFILESNLIKKYQPYFNRDLKDDKNYIWIMLDKREDFPQLRIVRSKPKKNADYLGPYHYTMPVKRILKRIRKIYPYRSCNRKIVETTNSEGITTIKSSDPKPCLYYHLGLCQAPCAGLVSKSQYRKNIKGIKTFFDKGHNELVEELKIQMAKYSVKQEYEKASEVRNKIMDLEYIKQRVSIESVDVDEIGFKNEKNESSKRGLEEILQKLDYFEFPNKSEFKIECFDISNIQGTNAVGSMVVFVDGKSNKDLYRKFKIKTKTTPDDFAMMREVLTRRFRSKRKDDKSFGIYPDLVIVDGGKGQLSAVYKVLLSLNLDIPVIGLAKKHEEIFLIKENEGELKFLKRTLKYRSDGYFLIQRIRDESHRFAINYHRKLRSMGQTTSTLDDVPGIGELTKKRLLQAFGSLEGIKKASKEDLQSIVKNETSVNNLIKVLNS